MFDAETREVAGCNVRVESLRPVHNRESLSAQRGMNELNHPPYEPCRGLIDWIVVVGFRRMGCVVVAMSATRRK